MATMRWKHGAVHDLKPGILNSVQTVSIAACSVCACLQAYGAPDRAMLYGKVTND